MDIKVTPIEELKADKPKEVVKKAGQVKVKTSTKHIGSVAPTQFKGKALVTLIDSKGNEFSVPEKEYVKYYSDESKFTVKKKAI